MGARTARITAEDFVTPPELADRKLATQGAGRIGGVRLELVQRNKQTRLSSSYQQIPLRVSSLDLGADEPALAYLVNPTAGLFDGDGQLIEIEAGPRTHAVVTGQSATRIHPSVAGFCTQQWRIRVQTGSVLVVLPGPAIPFEDCRYYQRVEIDLGENAHIIWADLWFAGRYARGEVSERFQFSALIQDLQIRQEGEVIFRDRFCWRGPWDADTIAWHFADYPACGSLFVNEAVARIFEGSPEIENLTPLATAQGHSCLRWVGPAEKVTAEVVQTALKAAGRLAHSERSWLLSKGHLAPTHWFTPQST